MRELELETAKWAKNGSTHFVLRIEEAWSGRGGVAVMHCGRRTSAENVQPRKFSSVEARNWCHGCYWHRVKMIQGSSSDTGGRG